VTALRAGLKPEELASAREKLVALVRDELLQAVTGPSGP
jgi:hypothetical protein